MDDKILKIQEKILQIGDLVDAPQWGAKFQVWDDLTRELVKETFGPEAVELFKSQRAVAINDQAYIRELKGKRDLLRELIAYKEEYVGRSKIALPNATHNPSPPVAITNSNFHFGDGDNQIRSEKNINVSNDKTPQWTQYVLAIVAILALGWSIYSYFSIGH